MHALIHIFPKIKLGFEEVQNINLIITGEWRDSGRQRLPLLRKVHLSPVGKMEIYCKTYVLFLKPSTYHKSSPSRLID